MFALGTSRRKNDGRSLVGIEEVKPTYRQQLSSGAFDPTEPLSPVMVPVNADGIFG
jgi:hypothetical protein